MQLLLQLGDVKRAVGPPSTEGLPSDGLAQCAGMCYHTCYHMDMLVGVHVRLLSYTLGNMLILCAFIERREWFYQPALG